MKRTFLTPIPVAASLLLVFGLFAFVPNSAASDFFLHSSTTDFLDNTSPTATTAKFKDSPAVNRTTYQEIGTWTAAPAAAWMRLNSLTDLHVWIGLKNSDDQGTYFDLRAELRKNGVVIASGETKTIQGVTRNPDLAKEVAVAFGPISGDPFNPGDVLSIKILTKVADSGGHNNAVGLRLYYDAVSRPSSFGAVFVVDTTPPTIAAVVNPAPNAAGWHKIDATVSFTCTDSESGVATCPAPIIVSTEGANQLVSGTATDLAGNSASTSVLISLDKSAPTVAISSPANGSSVTSSPVNVTGTATDNLSGIATVLCNGSPATLSASTFACDVPLTNGPNTITVEATDIAGNTGSSSITVTLGQPLEPQSPPVVFGPRRFTLPNEAVSFAVANPAGPFWLQVRNGEAVPSVGAEPGVVDMLNLVTAGSIRLNGVLVATSADFDHATTLEFGFQKDVTLTSVNTLEVQLQGPAGSFITVQITEAEPNAQLANQSRDLSALNSGDSIDLWWEPDENAAEYVVFRANSMQGPWQELFRRPQDRPNGVDFTPDAKLVELCYKVDAIDLTAVAIRTYEPICVPKFVETQTQGFAPTNRSPVKTANALSPVPARTQPQLGKLGFFSPLKVLATEPVSMNNAVGIATGAFPAVQAKDSELNPQVSNEKGDLSGQNSDDSIDLWWGPDERASEYIVFRADSMQGPWKELFRRRPWRRGNGVDYTPDATRRDLCYRIDAVDATGKLIRQYQPVCVPKYVQPKKQGFKRDGMHVASLLKRVSPRRSKTQGSSSRPQIQLASLLMLAASEPTDPQAHRLCFGNPDPEFTDWQSMGNDKTEIQKFLERLGSFLREPILDVDNRPIDPSQLIFSAAEANRINPQVILTILQREQGAVTAKTRLPANRLRLLAGYFGNAPEKRSIREQIANAAAQHRRDLDRLNAGGETIGGWKVGLQRETDDGVLIIPANNPAAAMYSYDPEAGEQWGGRRGVGGNARFCRFWQEFGFKREPVAVSPENPTLVCGPDASVSLTASGGRPPYTWLQPTKGQITTSGANNETATLTPPANTGSGVAGTAYVKRIAHVGSDCSLNLFNGVTWVCYNCAGVEFTCPPSGDPCFGQTCPQQNCGAGAGDCGQLVCGFTKCACLQPTQNVGDPASLELARSRGAVCDIRTQAVKDAGSL